MNLVLTTAVAALALAGCASPSTAPGADAHAAHHPPGATARTPSPSGYERQMRTMQEMHQKLTAARTSEERAALMRDHMNTMQDGMAMMGQMRGTTGDETMKRRMDMMESMMQMMIDREGARPPAAK